MLLWGSKLIVANTASNSQVCATAMMLLQSVQNYKMWCWEDIQWHKVHTEFRESHMDQKFRGHTSIQTHWRTYEDVRLFVPLRKESRLLKMNTY
jgi:hypothetical protein